MTTVELSQEQINEIFERQNGLCALSGKKLDSSIKDEFQVYTITENFNNENLDDFVLIWKNADFSSLNSNEFPEKPFRKHQFQFANFKTYNSDEKANEISADFELIKEYSKNEENLKNSINLTNSLQKVFQSLNLEDTFNHIQQNITDHLITLDQRYNQIRSKINEDSAKFFNEFNSKIEELKNVPSNWQNLRTARQKLLNLPNEIAKSTIKISKNTLEELKKNIANALTLIAQKQIAERENYEMECSDNYLQLKQMIDNYLPNIDAAKENNNYSKIRQGLIDIQKTIAKKTLKRNHQEELYQSIRNAFEKLSELQNLDKTRFMEEANENYEKLKPVVDNAITIATTTDSFKEARETLIAAQASIKGLSLSKEQRDDLYGRIREVFLKVNVQQEEERGEFLKVSDDNFVNLLNKINKEKERLLNNPHFKTIRESLLTIQGEIRILKLKTDHRNKLYENLKTAFSLLDEKRNSFFDHQQQMKKSKSDSVLKNLHDKLTILEEALEIDRKEMETLENSLNNNLTNDEADEVKSKINSIKIMIEEKNKRIQETKNRLEK